MFRLFILFLICPLTVFADDLAKGSKDTIFIGELKVQPSVIELAAKRNNRLDLQRVIESLDSQFTTSLNATRVFQLVERKRKEDIELEQKFAAVAVDPNDVNIAQGAKMAGAKFVFLPQIDGFEDKSTSTTTTKSYEFIGKSVSSTKTRRSFYLSVVVQIVDTTSGKLLPDSPSVQVDASMLPPEATGDRLYVELAKVAATKLAQETVGLLRPPKILDLTGNQVLINRGIESGFPVGTSIEIYAVKEVKDEDTGETFRNELPVGKAKIIRGDAKQSFATITGENLGVASGCIVRPVKVKEKKVNIGSNKIAKTTSKVNIEPKHKTAEKNFGNQESNEW